MVSSSIPNVRYFHRFSTSLGVNTRNFNAGFAGLAGARFWSCEFDCTICNLPSIALTTASGPEAFFLF